MRHERRFVDDEDEDINDFDPAYFPRKVYKDGRGPRVRLMLTDSAPPQRRQLYDASHHRPHFADLTDASLQRRAAQGCRGEGCMGQGLAGRMEAAVGPDAAAA